MCLTHRATSRQIFVNGAVACAERLPHKSTPGFYTFERVDFYRINTRAGLYRSAPV